MRKFFKKFKIQQIFSSRRYPKGNDQAKSTNKTLIICLKKRLDVKKGRWSDLLKKVLSANNTTKKPSTGETPF